MFGLDGIRLSILGSMFLLVTMLGATSVALWSQLSAKDAKIESQNHDLKVAAADVSRWQAAWSDSQAALGQLQEQIDAADVFARRVQRQQVEATAQRQLESRASQNRTSAILQILKDDTDARAIVATSMVREGFDPVVLVGIRWLQCLQSARAAGGDPARCQGRASLSASGSRTATTPAGAGHYSPTVTEQLWLLGLVYRFREWGEACYADKDAVGSLTKR
jgi:hypothetical protein